MDKWKGIRFGTKEPLELYDLDKDKFETTNIAAQHPEIVKKIETIMVCEHVDTPYWPVIEKVPVKKKRTRK